MFKKYFCLLIIFPLIFCQEIPGEPIISWSSTNIGAYTVYNENIINSGIYGNLYNWYAIDDERDICPENWHIPTNEEFITLEI